MGTNGTRWSLSTMVTTTFGASVAAYLDLYVLALQKLRVAKRVLMGCHFGRESNMDVGPCFPLSVGPIQKTDTLP